MRRREVHDNSPGTVLFGHYPEGGALKVGDGGGGVGNGPAVWPLDTSLTKAAETASGCR